MERFSFFIFIFQGFRILFGTQNGPAVRLPSRRIGIVDCTVSEEFIILTSL